MGLLFLGSLHWPARGADLGVGGISYVELLILYDLWAGERLSLEKAHPRFLRPGRPISVSAVPFGPGIDLWRSCRFIGALVPTGCDPAFCVVWFRSRLFRRYLTFWPSQVGRAYRLLEMVGEGCPGHGPIHLFSASAALISFRWDPLTLAWSRPGLPLLSNLAGPG